MTNRPARVLAGLIVCLTTFFSFNEIVLVCGYIWKGLFQGQTLFSCGKGHVFNISIEWIHLFVFSIWIRRRDGARVRRTLFLLGQQSIIEPRGGFSCQLTFSPIYTRPRSSSSTSSTHSLKICQVVVKSKMPTTEKQEDARWAITDVYQSVFSAYDTSAQQGELG